MKNNLKKNFKKNFETLTHTETIYTNNISREKTEYYNEPIYTNNIFNKISVTAVDNDEILLGLSPFIKTGVRIFKNNSDIINKHGIEKYLNRKNKNFPKIKNLINFQILSKIAQNSPEILKNPLVVSILDNREYNEFLISDLRGINKYLLSYLSSDSFLLNLHNIYYGYISTCYKIGLKRYKLQDFDFNIKIDDARNVVKADKNLYNLIFLDAFTPSKCPCLWTYEFFKRLYEILEQEGMLLTYSSSARVRSAMKEAGFEIGNIYNRRLNKFQGTIAVKNKSLLKYPLPEDEFGLFNSKAGIFYRDKNLKASNEAIITAHEIEVEKSNRMSSTQYLNARRNNGL